MTIPAQAPATLRTFDRMLGLLDGLQLDGATVLTILQSVSTYVSGAVLREFQELRVQREQEQASFDDSEFQADFSAWTASRSG